MTFRARIYRFAYPFYKIYLFVFRPKHVGACCVVECDGRVLLIRNTYGASLWSFPGGGVKRGESPMDAAMRETSEEVGIVPRNPRPVGKFYFDANGYNDIIYVFHTIVSQIDFKIDPNEILEAKWFVIDDAPIEKFSAVGLKIFEAFKMPF